MQLGTVAGMTKFDDLAVRYMVDLIHDFDFTPEQAAGPVGNGGTESGGFTQIQEISPTAGRGGLGHFQWTGPRRRDFETWLERNADKGWTAETYEANYSMLFRELVGPEAAAIAAVKRTTTLEASTEAFMSTFERPGVPHLDNRISWARKALAAFVAAGSPSKEKQAVPQAALPAAPLQGVDAAKLQEILQLVLPAILSLLGGKLGVALPQPVPSVTPAPVVVTAPPAPSGNGAIDLRAAVLGLVGSLGVSATGAMGFPGQTLTGTLVPLAVIAASAVGIPAPLARIGGSLISSLFGAIGKAAAK